MSTTMGWFSKNNDDHGESLYHYDQDDTPAFLSIEEDENASDYEKGAAFARAMIDHDRQHYQQRGHRSFREAIETGGQAWHRIVQREEYLVDHGHSERKSRLDYARGARSIYD